MKTDAVISMEYQLFKGFDAGGNPVFSKGLVEDTKVLHAIEDCIRGAKKAKHIFSATSLGEIGIIYKSGRVLMVKLIYDLKEGRYDNLIFMENEMYVACIELGALLDSQRRSVQ